MKKNLLLLSGAALIGSCALASAGSTMDTPKIHKGMVVTALSSTGKYALSSDGYTGAVSLINRESGETTVFMNQDEDNYDTAYAAGYGSAVSDNGIIVGSQTYSAEDASYCENGEWNFLPINLDTDQGFCGAHAITPDGKRIAGFIGRAAWSMDASSIMGQPVVWNRNAEDNGYDMYVELPFPEKDFLGQTPQYATAVWISSDGKKVAGQVTGSNGMFTYPIVYTEGEDGTWTYEVVCPDLFFNSEATVLPEPGEIDAEYPSVQDYLTEDNLAAYNAAYDAYYAWASSNPERNVDDYMGEESTAAYQAALEAYYEDWEHNSYPYDKTDYMTVEDKQAYEEAIEKWEAEEVPDPSIMDYLTEEGKAEYDAAYEAYSDAQDKWYEEWEAYEASLEEAFDGKISTLYNTLCLSGNGKYLLCTAEARMGWSYFYYPVLFDLSQNGKYYAFDSYDDLVGIYVANDGTILATSSSPYTARQAQIIPGSSLDLEGADFTTLDEYMQPLNSSLYSWMNDNMRHTYLNEYFDEDYNYIEETVENGWVTGCPTATPDLKHIASWQLTMGVFSDGDYGYDDGGVMPARIQDKETLKKAVAKRIEEAEDDEMDILSMLEAENIFESYILPMDYVTSIQSVGADKAETAPVEYYNLHGMKVQNPQQGTIYIVKQGTKVSKTVIK